MADWRQIQARIRKAKLGPEPSVRLAQLFEKTHDGMVAFELARVEEKAGQINEAVRWYTTAAQRFRRNEWRKKAEEALARLGAAPPVEAASDTSEESAVAPSPPLIPHAIEEPEAEEAQFHSPGLEPAAPADAGAARTPEEPSETPADTTGAKRRRRGRRGGRGRRRGREAHAAAAAAPAAPVRHMEPVEPIAEPIAEPMPRRRPEAERPATTRWQASGRAGEPALASRLAHLEANLRRLLASQAYHLDDAEQAPAGPGVYLLSDSDLTTSYYVESCKTLRIALAQLGRGRTQRSSERRGGLRARMAEHLDITEARVAKYLKDHCVIRWLQLDEGALHLAHFAVAVLRPTLNEDEA